MLSRMLSIWWEVDPSLKAGTVIFCKTQAVSEICDPSPHRFFKTWMNERYL